MATNPSEHNNTNTNQTTEKAPAALILARRLHLQHWQLMAAFLVLCDFLTIHTAYFFALWLRFDGYSRILIPS